LAATPIVAAVSEQRAAIREREEMQSRREARAGVGSVFDVRNDAARNRPQRPDAAERLAGGDNGGNPRHDA